MCIDQKTTIEMLHRALGACSIFDQIPEDKYQNVLHCLKSQVQSFEKDEILLNIGDSKTMSGIVLEGCISQTIMDENGNRINVDHIQAGEVFGADRAVSGWSDSVVELRAVTACRILFLNFSVLLEPNTTGCPFRARMTTNLLRDFATQSLFLNQRLQILGQKKLRDKIKVYFQTLHIRKNGVIDLPFSRHELADYLYADRSALSRELCRMRDEGIIEMQGRSILLTDPSFLQT